MKVICGPASKELAEAVSALTGFANVACCIQRFFPTANPTFV